MCLSSEEERLTWLHLKNKHLLTQQHKNTLQRSFQEALLLIRDPLLAVLEEMCRT